MAEKKEKKVSKSKLANYKNTTKHNIFTELGRCGPGATVALYPKDAEKYEGLEQCKTKS